MDFLLREMTVGRQRVMGPVYDAMVAMYRTERVVVRGIPIDGGEGGGAEVGVHTLIVVLQGLSESVSPPSPATTNNTGDSIVGHRK